MVTFTEKLIWWLAQIHPWFIRFDRDLFWCLTEIAMDYRGGRWHRFTFNDMCWFMHAHYGANPDDDWGKYITIAQYIVHHESNSD